MRADLNKVLCEDYRLGGDDYTWYRNSSVKDYYDHYEDLEDDIPHSGASSRGRTGMRTSKIYWNGRKRFNEHLNPLRGLIHKNVGRRWDKVYSELCAVFDKRSVINQHILDHLAQYVETKHIVLCTGKLFYQESWGRHTPADRLVPIRESRVEWYVDPRDGILKKNKPTKTRRQRGRESSQRLIKENLNFKQVFENGIELERNRETGAWYLYQYVTSKKSLQTYHKEVYDFALKTYNRVEVTEMTYPAVRNYTGTFQRAEKVCIKAKAMNGKELKFYGVENEAKEDAGISNAKLKRRAKRLQA